MNRTADEILTSIESKEAQAAELRQQLKGSLAIQKLWPEAFDAGTAKLGARATVHDPHKGTIIITRSDGEKREFEAMQVPFFLWPSGMQENFLKLPAFQKKPALKRMDKLQNDLYAGVDDTFRQMGETQAEKFGQ